MQLKKLQLVGFKTFADKTEIEIGEGLTAVVGPNGSGKSNIADAVLWVMGEQNPRLMRGTDSRDVIFAGTDRRKPTGMAEVKLTVDNADGSLPIDFAEVTITRRVYRSGESQYLLNNAPCRLKDVVELFLDTGLGKGAYAFVSQNEIDAVLSARAEDRRELFEEAAGIKKYRVKKREAVRKLDQAEANLTRVRDIVNELEQQREPLARQAEQAKRYLELTARLQEIEVSHLIAEVKRTDYELYAARQERELDLAAISRLDADLGRLERESEAVGARLASTEQEEEIARIAQQSAHSTVERTEGQLQLIAQRGTSAEASADALDEELRELASRIIALTKDSEQQSAALASTVEQERTSREKLAAFRQRLGSLEEALAEATRRSEDRQGALLRLAEQRAQREAALATCRTRLEETQDRLTRLSVDSAAAETLGTEVEARAKLAEAESISCTRRLEALAAKRTELEAQRRDARDAESRARTALEEAQRLLAERRSRLATLTELQESGEGFYQGVRAALKAHREGKLRGFYAPAVDLLTVPEELRVAIEVALGGSLQDVVCETEEQAKAAIEWLKSERAGRATFLALPNLRPAPAVPGSALKGISGLMGVGSELVSAEPRFAAVLQLLLGRVVVAEDMKSALAASRRLQGWSRIVTLQGELITPGGALTGGSLQGRGAHLVGRKGEIDDLTCVMPEIRAKADEHAKAADQAASKVAEIDEQLARLGGEIADVQVKAASAEAERTTLQRDLARIAASRAELVAEAKRAEETRTALLQEEARWAAEVKSGQVEDEGADEAIAAAVRESESLSSLRDAARSESVAMEVEAGRLAEKGAGLRRVVESIQHALRQAESARTQKQAQRELAGSQFSDAHKVAAELEGKLSEARASLARAEEQLRGWRERRQTLLTENFGTMAAIKEATQQRAQTLQEMHDAELRIARLEVRLAQAAQRLLEEYNLTQEEALARPDPGEIDRSTVNEVARLRRESRMMGQVNTGAVEEYERLTERHDFLAEQRADLETARESLLATIVEIDESTRESFMETFHAVESEFARLFTKLFSGGTTRLTLTTPDDLLETGIDVIAQPPGKKPQHLSLLSGGERALTAVALLFSFLAVRPSPFVLLDEVDAPLDGANVEKFVELVREFTRNSQFLVITHNPTTMEAAPRWYGVTMQEPGVSRILSYRVPEEALPSEPEESIELVAGG